MENPKINPYIPILIGVISVSLSAIFVKLANAEAGIIAFYRMLFSVLIMAPLFFLEIHKRVTTIIKKRLVILIYCGYFLSIPFYFVV